MNVGSLRAKLVAFVGGLLLASAAILGWTFYRQTRTLLEGELANRGNSLARSLAFHATYGLLTRDEVQLREVTHWGLAQSGVEFVEIRDLAGQVLRRDSSEAAKKRGIEPLQDVLAFAAPVLAQQRPENPGEELLAIPFGRGALDSASGEAVVKGRVLVGISTTQLARELRDRAARSMVLVAG